MASLQRRCKDTFTAWRVSCHAVAYVAQKSCKFLKMAFGKIIDLPKIMDPRGNLTVAEQLREIPFAVSRVYWVYDVPGGEHRGGHAHKHCREFIVAVSGSFTVTLDNGAESKPFLLNHPYQGLLVEAGVWRKLDDFSSGAVCLVLAEDLFDEDDYIRDYDQYLHYLNV